VCTLSHTPRAGKRSKTKQKLPGKGLCETQWAHDVKKQGKKEKKTNPPRGEGLTVPGWHGKYKKLKIAKKLKKGKPSQGRASARAEWAPG